MEHYKRKLNQNESILMTKVTVKMESIQDRIDDLMDDLAESKVSEAHLVKVQIKVERAKLVPYAYLKAGIASPKSRANYFPQYMDVGEAKQETCSAKFILFVETKV